MRATFLDPYGGIRSGGHGNLVGGVGFLRARWGRFPKWFAKFGLPISSTNAFACDGGCCSDVLTPHGDSGLFLFFRGIFFVESREKFPMKFDCPVGAEDEGVTGAVAAAVMLVGGGISFSIASLVL